MATVQTWDQFNKEYEFEKKFGKEALKELKKNPFNPQHAQHARKMIDFIQSPDTEAELNKQVQAALSLQQTPRADTHTPPAQEMKKQNKQQFKTPKWGKNFEPAIQIIVDRFNQHLASPDKNKALTQQYDNALKQMLRHRAELKLRATPKPQPGKKPSRPEPR